MLVGSHPPFSVGFPTDDENAEQKLRRALDNHILRPARRADGFYVSYCGENFRIPDCSLDSLDQTGKARLCSECVAEVGKALGKPLFDDGLPGWRPFPKL